MDKAIYDIVVKSDEKALADLLYLIYNMGQSDADLYIDRSDMFTEDFVAKTSVRDLRNMLKVDSDDESEDEAIEI